MYMPASSALTDRPRVFHIFDTYERHVWFGLAKNQIDPISLSVPFVCVFVFVFHI